MFTKVCCQFCLIFDEHNNFQVKLYMPAGPQQVRDEAPNVIVGCREEFCA